MLGHRCFFGRSSRRVGVPQKLPHVGVSWCCAEVFSRLCSALRMHHIFHPPVLDTLSNITKMGDGIATTDQPPRPRQTWFKVIC